jgi:hypothetical protein
MLTNECSRVNNVLKEKMSEVDDNIIFSLKIGESNAVN